VLAAREVSLALFSRGFLGSAKRVALEHGPSLCLKVLISCHIGWVVNAFVGNLVHRKAQRFAVHLNSLSLEISTDDCKLFRVDSHQLFEPA
jgi:hypothetical protein